MARKHKPKGKIIKLKSAAAAERASRTVLQRTGLLMVLFGIIMFIPLIATLYNLMIVEHDRYQQLAINNQTRTTPLSADRGVIYDRNMNILASSATVETIFIDPNALQAAEKKQLQRKEDGKTYNAQQNVDFIARGLAEILDVEASFVREQAADTTKYYKVIRRKVSEELAQEVRAFISENDLTGIHLETDSQRYYPYASLGAQILGFVRSDNVGAEGLEAYYDATLTGNGGAIVTTKGNLGTEMLFSYEKYYDASDGGSLVLTEDVTVQYYLEKNLEEAMEKYVVENGAFGIVMNAKTGEILAMATLGSFDPNNYQEIYDDETRAILDDQYADAMRLNEDSQEFEDAIAAYNAAVATARLKQWRNRCVSDGYEPGSTFKPITLAAGLDCGAVTLSDTYYCDGHEDFAGREQTVDCWKTVGHGSQTTIESLGNSCNIAFSAMSIKIGGAVFYDYVKAFGFTERTGVDMPGEAAGLFFSRDSLDYNLNGHSTASLISASFGQTFRITPIQLVRAIAATVNGGYLLEPYIVKEVQDSEGNTIEKTETTVLRQVISEETSAIMREALEHVVAGGTAKGASVPGYRVGGKTGTSEKIDVFDENGERTDDKIVSFVGIAPMEDPEYVVLVALDTPSKETGLYISGGQMAAPTVGKVLADILPYLGVEPNYDDDDLDLITLAVPDMTGKTEAEASYALSDKSFTYRRVGSGAVVTAQVPEPGAMIPGKSQVILYFDEEPSLEKIEMPDFSDMTLVSAKRYAQNNGVYMLTTGVNQDAWNVVATYQSIPAGTLVDPGTTVTVEFTDVTVED